MVNFAINNGENQKECQRLFSRATAPHILIHRLVFLTSLAQPLEEKGGGMIRNSLAGFYFYADDTLSSPGPWMLLALDFLTVFCELDQLFTTM